MELGLPDKIIAERLVPSVETVEKHAGAVLRKTGARNRTELAAQANRVRELGRDAAEGGVVCGRGSPQLKAGFPLIRAVGGPPRFEIVTTESRGVSACLSCH